MVKREKDRISKMAAPQGASDFAGLEVSVMAAIEISVIAHQGIAGDDNVYQCFCAGFLPAYCSLCDHGQVAASHRCAQHFT